MKNIKLCSFVVNYTHSCIITSNFISKEFVDAKVIYINENSQKEKLEKIANKYFKNLDKKIIYMEWLNEEIINDYANENIILVVNGSEKISDIINKHDYFLNTNGLKSINAC